MNTSTVYLQELPYSPDSCGLFARVRQLPNALLLDSSHPHSLAGRYDILTAEPERTDDKSSGRYDSKDFRDKYDDKESNGEK